MTTREDVLPTSSVATPGVLPLSGQTHIRKDERWVLSATLGLQSLLAGLGDNASLPSDSEQWRKPAGCCEPSNQGDDAVLALVCMPISARTGSRRNMRVPQLVRSGEPK